jgi:TRAP-type C4-dicarboxylate transport system permease small subunit
MKKFNDHLEKVLLVAIVTLLSAMTLVVVLGIIARYVLLISIPWTEELARYLMIWTGFFAFGVAYRRRELILVRLLIDRLPPRLYQLAMFISDLLCSFFLVLVIIYGWRLCLANATQVSPAARIPMSLIYSAVPVGCAICLLFICESMVEYWKKKAGVKQSW